jgi:AraC family transcriptional activator of pobA
LKNSLFTESRGTEIPAFDLHHEDQAVLFAYRTMEEIFDESGATPDDPHKHNFYTIIFSKKGKGEHTIDFTKYIIKDNRVFFLMPGQVHQVYTPVRPEGLVIMFTGEFLCKYHINEDFLTNLGLFSCKPDTPPLDLSEERAAKIFSMGKEIEALFYRGDRYVNEAVASWLKLFLIECNSELDRSFNGNTQLLETGRDLVGRFRRLLEERFREWHQVSDYSDSLNITSDYLNTVMKDAVGTNAKDFIQKRIIVESKRLGIHTELTSKEIAYSLGFQDPAHFSNFFKKREGVTFSQFRES